MPCGELEEEPKLEGTHSAAGSCNNSGSQLFNLKLIIVLKRDNYIASATALHSEHTVTPLRHSSVTLPFSSWLCCE